MSNHINDGLKHQRIKSLASDFSHSLTIHSRISTITIPHRVIRLSPFSSSRIHNSLQEPTLAQTYKSLPKKNEYKIEGISFEYHVDKFSKNMKSIVSLSSISTKSTKPTEGEFHFCGYRHPKSCPQTPTFLTFASNPTVERTATSQ